MECEDDDPYETLPPTASPVAHMVAGACAGITEHCVMYPIDMVKTRIQCALPSVGTNRSIYNSLKLIVKTEGALGTTRGVFSVMAGAGPAHALYFSAYEHMKIAFNFSKTKYNHGANFSAGVVATVLHDAIMNPAEVVKQRMQLYNVPYQGCVDCAKRTYGTEGVIAFYRSYPTQLVMNIPFHTVHFVIYEALQDLLNSKRTYNPWTHIVAGGVAGATAAAITTPLDVCKTMLNTQCMKLKEKEIRGLTDAFKVIRSCHGYSGFFRGMQARVIFQAPATALSWSVYEFFKFILVRSGPQSVFSSPSGSTTFK